MTDAEIEQIYNQYFKSVRAYAYSLCLDNVLADDITQETFMKALKSIDTFRGDCKLEVWLCRIAKNTFYSLVRKKKVVPLDEIRELPFSIRFEDGIDDTEDSKSILQALQKIGSPYSDVFYMRVLGGLDYAYISDVFGKSEPWARVTYYRAKEKIIQILRKGETK